MVMLQSLDITDFVFLMLKIRLSLRVQYISAGVIMTFVFIFFNMNTRKEFSISSAVIIGFLLKARHKNNLSVPVLPQESSDLAVQVYYSKT